MPERPTWRIDGHRTDNFGSYLLATHDQGRSWQMITGDLPKDAPVKVVREDLDNPSCSSRGRSSAST